MRRHVADLRQEFQFVAGANARMLRQHLFHQGGAGTGKAKNEERLWRARSFLRARQQRHSIAGEELLELPNQRVDAFPLVAQTIGFPAQPLAFCKIGPGTIVVAEFLTNPATFQK